MASADTFLIKFRAGRRTAQCLWGATTPIVIGSHVVMGLQVDISRSVNISQERRRS
jgi:hypothetical protein